MNRNEIDAEFYSRTTSFSPMPHLNVFKPNNIEELQALVVHLNKVEQQYMLVSVGKNWAYGDSTAGKENICLISLEKMNRIIEVNDKLGYAIIEPGVTQRQLYDYLLKHNISLKLDVTGAGEDTSIVGNILERGFGHTRYGNRSAQISDMQILTSEAELIDLSWQHFEKSPMQNLMLNTFGPELSALFIQSDFAIVTRMSILLQKKPEHSIYYFLRMSSKFSLATLLNQLTHLKQQNLIHSHVHTGNVWRAVSASTNFDNLGTDPHLISEQSLAKKFSVGVWSSAGVIEGNKELVKAQARIIKKEFKNMNILIFSQSDIDWINRLYAWFKKIVRVKKMDNLIQNLNNVSNLLNGIPSSYALKGAMWKLSESEIDIKKDLRTLHAKQFCLSPMFPANGEIIEKHLQEMSKIIYSYQFEPMITLTLISERSYVAVINVDFKNDLQEMSRAEVCHKDLVRYMLNNNLYPYRLNKESASDFWEQQNPKYRELLRKIKKALDPKALIHNSRYSQQD